MINPENDIEAWQAYPKDRWVYNKLDLSLKLNYYAGPACVPIKRKSGNFCIRPIINLSGMGIGAVKKRLNVTVHASEMENHAHVPPGYFWCEWFNGPHISVDFTKNLDTKKWEAFSAMEGFHENDLNLTKFIRWKVVKPELDYNLPNWVHDIKTEKYLNIEFRQGKIIEIHLRSGNDSFWSCALGTEILPVWKNVKYNKIETSMKFIPNFYEGLARYEASGHQTDVRIGYYIDE